MRLIIIVGIFITGSIVAYIMIDQSSANGKLKVINPIDVKPEMVDSLLRNKGFGHRIGAFSFANQYGDSIKLSDVKGKVFVAEYFFTTCGTICPIMNFQMKRVQTAYKQEQNLKILSFTVDPEIDTVSQMKRYADSHGAIKGKWHFLTGNKSALYKLARTSFFVLKPSETENAGDAGSDFIHTNNFVLVDQDLCIRGYYDGTSQKAVDKLIWDIEILMNEKK